MKCPGCKVELMKERIQKTEIDRCPSCLGMWLDKGELNKLADEKNKMVEFNSVEYDPGFHGDTSPSRNCPKCGDRMKKVDLLQDSPVIYDYCPVCEGFWLDADELRQTKILLEKSKEEGKVLDNIFLAYVSLAGREPELF